MARNKLHNVEFAYYRCSYPLGHPESDLFGKEFREHAPGNALGIAVNVAQTECIVKAPAGLNAIPALEVYAEPPTTLIATAAWRQA